ncbi:MAG TPA: helix-turn-helix domain-containing protein [Methanocorpusculum sp.]|nr:helix-turn-helix domain-containing protein [Methanocorpusculum sp.]
MMTVKRTMDDEMLKSITERLVATGFREYDAIIYVTLFTVGIAKVSELYELTKIPRGRIYDTLQKLHEGGFVTEFGSNPQYYQVCEAEKTLISIYDAEMMKLREIRSCLKDLQEINHPGTVLQVNEYHTQTAIEIQIAFRLNRAKKEIVIVSHDRETLEKYADLIREAAHRIPTFLIVMNEEVAKAAPIKCYMTDNKSQKKQIEAVLYTGKDRFKYLIYFCIDRESSLGVLDAGENKTAYSIESDIYLNSNLEELLKSMTLVK